MECNYCKKNVKNMKLHQKSNRCLNSRGLTAEPKQKKIINENNALEINILKDQIKTNTKDIFYLKAKLNLMCDLFEKYNFQINFGIDKIACVDTTDITLVETALAETALVETTIVENTIIETVLVENTIIETTLVETALVETTLVETALVENTLVETTLVETTLVETALVETALVENTLVETALVETALVETTLVEESNETFLEEESNAEEERNEYESIMNGIDCSGMPDDNRFMIERIEKKLKEYNQNKNTIDMTTYRKIKKEVVEEWADDQMAKIMESMNRKYDTEESREKKKKSSAKFLEPKENCNSKFEESKALQIKERNLKEVDARNNDKKMWFQNIPSVSDHNMKLFNSLKESPEGVRFECNLNYKWSKGDPHAYFQIENLHAQNKISKDEYDRLMEEYNDTISNKRDKIERGYDMFIDYQEFLNSFRIRKNFYEHLTNNANDKWKPQFMTYIKDYFDEQRKAGFNVYMYDWEIVGFLLEKKDYRNIDYNKVNLRKILGWPEFICSNK